MKAVIVFACVILAAWTASAENIVVVKEQHAPDRHIVVVEEQKLHHLHDACQADPATHADHELLHHLAENIDNPQVGAHMLCESTKVGLQKENGELDLENIKTKIALTVTNTDTVNRLVEECAVKKKSPEKTAINLFLCLDNNGITYFHEF